MSANSDDIERIIDLIRYENECVRVDFKAAQYTKGQHAALIKDIASMANADIEGDRFIVVGVKHYPGGTRDFIGVEGKKFVDSAIYHQIIAENIEPDLNVDYFPVEVDDKTYGVFRIGGGGKKPYLLKKDYKDLKKGDGYIRKGSHQPKMIRSDYERIYSQRAERNTFIDRVDIVFSETNSSEITICSVNMDGLSSQRTKDHIQGILKKRKSGLEISEPSEIEFAMLSSASFFSSPPYVKWPTKRLESKLDDLDKEDLPTKLDLFELFEERSKKLDVSIINRASSYIEDASIDLSFENPDGLVIADHVYEPPPSNHPFAIHSPSRVELVTLNYPEVRVLEDRVEVTADIGDIRHGVPTKAFQEPLRVVVGHPAIGKTIEVTVRLRGKNLPSAIESSLCINVVAWNPSRSLS